MLHLVQKLLGQGLTQVVPVAPKCFPHLRGRDTIFGFPRVMIGAVSLPPDLILAGFLSTPSHYSVVENRLNGKPLPPIFIYFHGWRRWLHPAARMVRLEQGYMESRMNAHRAREC